MLTLNCNGKVIDLSIPKVMGVINLSPNSFYQNSIANNINEAILKCEQMIKEGVDIIDVGGQTTKPYSNPIEEEEELRVVMPLIKQMVQKFPHQIFSIDTFYTKVAMSCADIGVAIINDISGGDIDKEMFTCVAKLKLPYVCSHIRGTPENMQLHTNYNNIMTEMMQYFDQKIKRLKDMGVKDILLDVGIGFAKTTAQNFHILNHLKTFQHFKQPLVIGISRKSFLYKSLQISPENSLNATSAMHIVALQNGAKILRTHDVATAKECINLFLLLNQNIK